MIAATRPLATATAALMGAAVIAATPALPSSAPALPQLSAPEIALTSSVFDIFKFPVWQQALTNEVEFLAIWTDGLAQGSAGFVQSAVELPAALLTATQQVLNRDPLGALTTVEDWTIAAGEATLVPPVAANIEVGQIQLAIQSALLLAQPVAAVHLGSALFNAFDSITRSFIVAGQNFVDAVLSLNIGNMVRAVIDGVAGVVKGFADGGQAIVDGIVDAQTTLATALRARPISTPQPYAAAAVLAAPKPAAEVIATEAAAPAPHRTATTSRAGTAHREAGSDTTDGGKAAADDNDGSAKSGSRRGASR